MLMNVKDFRIGDYIYYNGSYRPITTITSDKIIGKDFDLFPKDIQPVPITTELLRIFGFVFDNVWKLGNVILSHIFNNTYKVFYTESNKTIFKGNVSYLHELQHKLWDLKIELI